MEEQLEETQDVSRGQREWPGHGSVDFPPACSWSKLRELILQSHIYPQLILINALLTASFELWPPCFTRRAHMSSI